MLLTLQRGTATEFSTPGEILINGAHQCFTLELPPLLNGVANVPDKTCILAGTFAVILTESKKFGRIMPLLVDVPNRSAVEIHWGNKPADTLGCILVGCYRDTDTVTGSKVAFEALFAKLLAATRAGDIIKIQIIDAA